MNATAASNRVQETAINTCVCSGFKKQSVCCSEPYLQHLLHLGVVHTGGKAAG